MAKKKKIVYQIPNEALPAYFKDIGFSDEEIKKLVSAATGKAVNSSEKKNG